MSPTATTSQPLTLPIVDRVAEVQLIAQMRDDAARGKGSTLLLSGDGGVGKTRLVIESSTQARVAGFQVAVGQPYAVETAIPYAPFADALEPLLLALEPHLLTRLTRGDRSALNALAPSLSNGAPADQHGSGLNVAEQRVRLHSTIIQLLAKLAERQPLMLVLENLQWADVSSIELFHFIARQLSASRILLIASWNETERELSPALSSAIRSLRSLGACREIRLAPLSEAGVRELLVKAFAAHEDAVAAFSEKLFDKTRGNPLFIDQTLRDLVQRGELRRAGDLWIGWQLDVFVLPHSVRDVLRARIDRLTPAARYVAEWVAIIGTSAPHDLLVALNDSGEPELHTALDELRAAGMLIERLDGTTLTYDLSHPLLRQALSEMVGIARERSMHAAIANTLEVVLGAKAEQRADQLAAHWRRAEPSIEPSRAIKWLTLAGERAVERLARREGAVLLRAALDRADEVPDAADEDTRGKLVDELSRIYRRLGEYQNAVVMATRARDTAAARGDLIGVAIAERRLGLSVEGLGHRREGIIHFNNGIAAAEQAGDDVLLARLHLAKGTCLQALGQPDDAKQEVATALLIAERLDRVSLLARAHRLLLMMHLWSGPAHRAWTHARSAVALAERSGERNVAWSAHWAAAVLGGMTSNTSALQRHLAEATRLADELSSPMLQLRTIEIAIEYRAGIGEWDKALLDGERAIATARSLEQTTLLARLLQWVATVYLHRGDTATARRLYDEAWTITGAESVDFTKPFEVHGIVPAYLGRVTYLAAMGEYQRVIELGNQAAAIADRSGNMAWVVYRLLPTIADAALCVRDNEALAEVRRRLAHDAAWLSHPIGQAWVDIIDGELALRAEDFKKAIVLFQGAVATLEAVPFAFDAANTRIRLARALQASGDAGESAREAKAALQMFESLRARPAADNARALLRTLGAHMPGEYAPGEAFSMLTSRELEIVRLVAQRLSNKEIGSRLGISDRTVGTHLANIFGKTTIRDRTLLGDTAREHGLHRVS